MASIRRFTDMFAFQTFLENPFKIKFHGQDHRSDAYFLSSPLSLILLIGLYFYLIFSYLPRHMQNRAAYQLRGFVIFYNAAQIIMNLYLLYLSLCRWQTLNWFCSPIDYGDTPQGLLDLQNVHLFLLVKILDFIDTMVFVLRKKITQVTFLHVFHHVMMVVGSWCGLVFWGGGHITYVGLVNSIVHSVMYFYYLLTIWKPEQRNNLWWKKHLTQLQLGQFGFFLVTYGQQLLKSSCSFSKSASAVVVAGAGLMVFLFGNFYYRTYIQRKKKIS